MLNLSVPLQDPRQPNNLTATLLNVQAGRCQPLPAGISADCRDVIMGLLCPDPQHRTRLEVSLGMGGGPQGAVG